MFSAGGADDAPAQAAVAADSTSIFPPVGLLQAAFDSAGIDDDEDYSDPRLHLFLVDHLTPPQRLRRLLAAAWGIDPNTTLKLVCYLRRTGNAGAEEGFYTAAAWMHRNHPRTLAGNLPAFAELGFIQDFPELLHRLVVQDAEEDRAVAEAATIGRKRARSHEDDDDNPAAPPVAAVPHEPMPAAPALDVVHQLQPAVDPGPEAAARLAAVALYMRRNDAAYRFLHDSVAGFFATNLRADLDRLTKGGGIPLSNIGLAAKWCPSPDSPFDQTTLLYDAIACRFFPSDDGSDEHQRRQRLRDQVLVPLQSALMQQSPHKKNTTSSRSVTAPLPYKIVQFLARENKDAGRKQRAIVQWGAMLQDMRIKGSLANCLAVCDMSKGMGLGTAMKVTVAMTLLTSQLSADPWTDWIHAFNKSCTPHLLAGRSYEQKVEYIRKMQCDDKFNLRKVFDRILFNMVRRSKDKKPSPKVEPVNTIFVFTHRDFDEALVPPCKNKRPEDFDPAAVRPWKDEYDNICDKFSEAGFEVPQVVFWNLMGQRSPALTFTSDGVMRLSGYSDDLMMLFLEKNGVVEPEDELYHAIAGEEYQKLKVHD